MSSVICRGFYLVNRFTRGAGTTGVSVNQRQRGGEWVLLGTFDFVPGQGHRARITDNANGLAMADAVKFPRANASKVYAIYADHLNTLDL